MGDSEREECRRTNGNCTADVDPDDGLAVQCVGPWATDKHDYLRRYLEATSAVRAKFSPPNGHGGAAFIDLFAGPGRARIDSRTFIDGSPLIAACQAGTPFTKLILCDIDDENVSVLRSRVQATPAATVMHVDCNARINDVVREIPEYGYNVALLDPFAASALHFSTIEKLAAVKRMDLLIHFPLGSMKRNYMHRDPMESFLGLPYDKWGVEVNSGSDVAKLLDVFRGQLERLGYPKQSVRSPAIKNTHNLPLYHLVFASKNSLGEKIWNSITKREPSGQTNLF